VLVGAALAAPPPDEAAASLAAELAAVALAELAVAALAGAALASDAAAFAAVLFCDGPQAETPNAARVAPAIIALRSRLASMLVLPFSVASQT